MAQELKPSILNLMMRNSYWLLMILLMVLQHLHGRALEGEAHSSCLQQLLHQSMRFDCL